LHPLEQLVNPPQIQPNRDGYVYLSCQFGFKFYKFHSNT
jgi:hypothetical protein